MTSRTVLAAVAVAAALLASTALVPTRQAHADPIVVRAFCKMTPANLAEMRRIHREWDAAGFNRLVDDADSTCYDALRLGMPPVVGVRGRLLDGEERGGGHCTRYVTFSVEGEEFFSWVPCKGEEA